jgi:hypothetical protein
MSGWRSAPWEQAASLRLRGGDTTVLAEYDQHARIIGGDPVQMMDAEAAAYTTLTAEGTDALLMATINPRLVSYLCGLTTRPIG